jgi:hypothetical protein
MTLALQPRTNIIREIVTNNIYYPTGITMAESYNPKYTITPIYTAGASI